MTETLATPARAMAKAKAKAAKKKSPAANPASKKKKASAKAKPAAKAATGSGFDRKLLAFLRDLAANNNRDWFTDNKDRFETDVREPVRAFIRAIGPGLKGVSSQLWISDKKSGGSMLRIFRDVRFSKDKTPYKTNVGVHFRHQQCGDVHAPGFYLHLEPGACGLGAGLWQPDSESLAKIREAIDAEPKKWTAARDDKALVKTWGSITGESLKRPPKGYDKDHPLIEDLKRKDFTVWHKLTDAEVTKSDFHDQCVAAYAATKPLMSFLCKAIDVRF